jgi:hypothetical protein
MLLVSGLVLAFFIAIFNVEFSKLVVVTGVPFATWSGLSIVEIKPMSVLLMLKTSINCVP